METRQWLLDRHGPVCAYCGRRISTKGITLDHVTRALHESDILITDESGPISMAGTMGGLATEIDDDSTDIVIEGAHATMGRTRLSTLTVSPGPSCSGFYEQVIYWDVPCDKLKATVFASFGSPHVILHNVQVSELNAGLQLYLMPSGAGCTSVKKEMFH